MKIIQFYKIKKMNGIANSFFPGVYLSFTTMHLIFLCCNSNLTNPYLWIKVLEMVEKLKSL